MTVQNLLIPQREVSSGLDQFHFGLKEAQSLSLIKELFIRNEEENPYNPKRNYP
jgi:hypothetical protein